MTNDPTPDRNDPLRALDAVEPADRWDDVVSRSTEGELLELAPVAARRSFPRPLLAAAAVLAVVALAGGVFALTRGGDDDHQNLATDLPGEGGRVAAPTIWNSTWELVVLERNGELWEVADAVDGKPPRIVTTEPGAGAISLWACNHSSGAATQEGDQLVVTDFLVDLSACLPEAGSPLLDQEQFVVELLEGGPTIAIEADAETGDGSGAGFENYGIGDRLILTTAEGSVTFERTEIGSPVDGGTAANEPHELWGRVWTVTSMTSGGKSKFVALPFDGASLRLNANTTGQLNFNGCNGAGGEFDLDGDRLTVIAIGPSTAMGCEQALMDQDEWLQAFLEAEPTVTIDGNHLTLTAGQDTIELEAVDAVGSAGDGDPKEILDRTWEVVQITDDGEERALVPATDGLPPRLMFSAEGQIVIHGCTTGGGEFGLMDARLIVDKAYPTANMILCNPQVVEQDDWFIAFLEADPTVLVDGNALTLTTDQAVVELVTTDAVVVGQPVEDPNAPEDDGSVSSPPQTPGSAVDPDDLTTIEPEDAEESVPPSSPSADPTGFWGRKWTVVNFTDGGQERLLIAPADGSPLRLDTSITSGFAGFNGCNGAGGIFELDGNRLVMTEALAHRNKLCSPAALMGQEVWLRTFLGSAPIVTIDGDNLTLATDDAIINLEAA